MRNWFSTVQSIEDLKKEYRRLAKKYHPDQGGDAEVFKEIYAEFEKMIEAFVHASFNQYEEKSGKEAYGNAFVFADIIKDIIHFNITIQIVGFWIYAFDSYEYKDQLKEKGFFFSKKHKAWIYNGGKKKRIKTNYKLDDIRKSHGYQTIKEKEEQEKLTNTI